jgi:hypothetical protein
MSFVDATLQLSDYGALVGGSRPLRPIAGTGVVETGFKAEIIDGQYYPDRPLPVTYRPLESPYGNALPIVNAMQDNFGIEAAPFGAVALLYANQSRYTAAIVAGRDAENGLNLRA